MEISKTSEPSIGSAFAEMAQMANPKFRPNVTRNTTDPSANLREVLNADINEYSDMNPLGGLVIDNKNIDSLNEDRAYGQTHTEMLGHAAMQAIVGEFVGGTVEGIGILSRPDKWVDRVRGTVDAFDTSLLEQLGESIQEKTRDSFPIYTTKAAQQGMAFKDASWYYSMLPSLASAASILLPARAAAILPVKLAKYISEVSMIGKVGKLADAGIEGGKAAEVLASANKGWQFLIHGTDVVASSIAGRVIDSTRESLGKYNEYYQENKAKGMDDLSARSLAADAAARGFRNSHVNLVFDIIEWGTLLKVGNYLEKGYVDKLNQTLFKNAKYVKDSASGALVNVAKYSRGKTLLLDMLKTIGVEGLDEATMDIFQQEGKYSFDRETGNTEEKPLIDRLGNYLTDKHIGDSFIGGAVGGLLFMPLGVISEKVFNRKGIAQTKANINNIVLSAEQLRKQFEEMSSALDNNDAEKAQTIKDNMVTQLVTKSYAKGTLGHDLELLNNLSVKSADELVAEGLNPSVSSYVAELKDNIAIAKKIFDSEVTKVYDYNTDGTPSEMNFPIALHIAQLKTSNELLKKRRNQYVAENDYDNIIDDSDRFINLYGEQGANYYNTLARNKSIVDNINSKKTAIKNKIDEVNKSIIQNQDVIANSTNYIQRNIASKNQLGLKSAKVQLESYLNNLSTETEKAIKDNDLSLKAFDGVDQHGNPILDNDTRSKINDVFKNEATTERQAIRNKVNYFDSSIALTSSLINHYSTKEGIEQIKETYEKNQKDYIATTKSEIEDQIKDASEEELKILEDTYKKTGVDESIYKPLIKSRRTDIKNKAKIDKENARRAEENTKASEVSNEVENISSNHEGRSPSVPVFKSDSEKVESSTKTTEAKVDEKVTEFSRNNSDLGSALNSTENNIFDDNAYGNTIALLDIIFTKKNRDIIFKDNSALKNMSIGNIYRYFITLNSEKDHAFGKVFFDLVALANTVSNHFNIIESKNGFDIVGAIDESSVFGKEIISNDIKNLMDDIDSFDNRVFNNIKDSFSKYTSIILEQYSENISYHPESPVEEEFGNILINNAINNLNKYIDYDFIDNPEVLFKTSSIPEALKITAQLYKRILIRRQQLTGNPNTKITLNDVFKTLRDMDLIYEKYNDVLFGLATYKNYIAFRKKDLARQLKKLDATEIRNTNTIKTINRELSRLNKIDDTIAINNFDKINDATVDYFMRYYPKITIFADNKNGVKTVINTYDKDNRPIELSTNDLTFIESDDESIYHDLEKIHQGAEVTFEPDTSIEYKNSNEIYDAGTQPIRVKLVTPEGTSKNTVMYIRSLSYISGGIAYGRFENGTYNFYGISDVFNPLDYQQLSDNIDLIRSFYYNYRTSKLFNNKDSVLESRADKADKLLTLISSNKLLKETILKAINNNKADSEYTSVISDNDLAGLGDAIFYGIRLEDLDDDSSAVPSRGAIENKIKARDNAYRSDFENIKALRIAIANGDLKSAKIEHVSTPSVIHMNNDHGDMNVPRYTLDSVVKPIDMGDGLGKRVVLVKYYNGFYYDLTTGKSIGEDKIDYKKDAFTRSLSNSSDNIRVLLEAPNGKYVLYNVNANTIGNSYTSKEEQDAAINVVTSNIMSVLLPEEGTDIGREAFREGFNHITIYDEESNKNEFGYKKDYNYFESYLSKNEKRITIATPINGVLLFNNIVIRNGIANIYRSPNKKDVIDGFDSNGKRIRGRTSNKYKKDGDFNINITTEEGKQLLESKIREIAPNMIRQAHIDNVNHKFTYSKKYKGESITDPITGKTYSNPTELYIKTGAIYSNVGAVVNESGKILTNFDLRGRFPLNITIDSTAKPLTNIVAHSISELVGTNNIINPNDPYLDTIKFIESKVAKQIKSINVTSSLNPDNKSVIAKATPIRAKSIVNIYGEYFNVKAKPNTFMPASLYIGHELLHAYMNKRYSKGDVEDIKRHNEIMTNYVNELVEAWNKIDNKVSFMEDIFNINTNTATKNVKDFESFIKLIKENADRINNSVTIGIENGTKLNGINTIQEPITYAFTNPLIAITLNNIKGSEENIDFKSNKKNSFWNLLIDKFLSILKRLFNTDINNDSIEFNTKSQLAKLNNYVNAIFDKRLSVANSEYNYKVNETSSTASEVSSEIEMNETVEEHTYDINEESIDSAIAELDNLNIDSLFDEDIDMTSQESVNFNTEIDLNLMKQISSDFISPYSQLLDDSNRPIC